MIITFDPNGKFTPKGTLEKWQKKLGPVVGHQTYPMFLLMYAFVGPLLRFAPPHILNPQVELVGKRETGKTTAAAAAASIWAGDPERDVGGGEDWDLTINALDIQKRAHSDSLMFNDEINLAGTSSADQVEVVSKSVFKIASTGGRKRLTDAKPVPNLRLALLSTSNVPLRRLVKAKGAVLGALASRMITIRIGKDRPYGILDRVPDSFADARQAMQHLRAVINSQYGTAGQSFIARLVKERAADERALGRSIQKRMNRFLKEVEQIRSSHSSIRIENTLAVTYAAGRLARDWGILPRTWGSLLPVLLQIYRSLQKKPVASPLDRVRQYVETHREQLVKVESMAKPYTAPKFESTAGFLRCVSGGYELLVPTKLFQEEFPDHRLLMQALKKASLARTEGGNQTKLSIKVPKVICSTGRVYCIRLRA
ncbi:DUF927 domain-containing protein [Microvirga aerophila]|uniref:DUF927 domain-containing protein n=1 Tax=Microvirga aerophila TaxID=670291 RepID=A0A512C1J5_9HYPH|nr:DUF927 domain-containing protein [Microvirga aerophila]GEO18063.1 hypothetical protein MAE02_57590 [Microvirga aerophila]